MVTSLLSESDAREVEAAIGRVERATAAEVVVAVVAQSAEHWRGRVAVAGIWSIATALSVLHYLPRERAALAFLAQVAAFFVAYSVLGARPILRWFVAPRAAAQASHARAFQLFAERGLHRTKTRSAVLIFVSELERRVVLLGDAGIHAELGQRGWEVQVELLLKRIRERHLREGLLEVLAELEPRLAAVAPHQPDDENELPDSVLRE